MPATLPAVMAAAVLGLPPGFSEEPVVTGLTQPIDAAFLPDGRMLVLERAGRVVISDPHATPAAAAAFLDIPSISTGAFRGALGLAVDPGFTDNGFIYVYYCHGLTERFRIARFALAADTANPYSEAVIWEAEAPWGGASHYGGMLAFGPDGMLFLARGEEDDPPLAQDLTTSRGSVLRIAPDGSVPPGNPFADGPGGHDDFIWAYGLRNPFRGTWDLETSRLFIGEVGAASNAWEDLHLGVIGANYGWPDCFAGPCDNPAHPACSCKSTDTPIFSYAHDGGPAAIIAGTVHRGSLFPDAYEGALFYGDFVQGWIRFLTFDETGLAVTGDLEFTDVVQPVALESGPDGAIYICSYGLGRVIRIAYDDGTTAPTITSLSAEPASGTAPLDVVFSATAEDDEPDLQYRWTFGDGFEGEGAVVEHTYASNGHFAARLEVSDATHTTFSPAIPITLGTAPEVTITAPADGSAFRAGQTLAFSADAVDAEEELGDEAYRWTAFLHGAGGSQVLLGPVSGAAGELALPTSGLEVDPGSVIELRVVVTDSDGFFATTASTLIPELVLVTLETDPPGLLLGLDGATAAAPVAATLLVAAEHQVLAPQVQCVAAGLSTFAAWSDGGDAAHVITVPDVDTTLTASYVAGGTPGGDATFDGIVDVDDLLAVILGWGPCDGGAMPCSGDVDCSGEVDVDDLVTVVLNWG